MFKVMFTTFLSDEVPYIPPGPYRVKSNCASFATSIANVGFPLNFPWKLQNPPFWLIQIRVKKNIFCKSVALGWFLWIKFKGHKTRIFHSWWVLRFHTEYLENEEIRGRHRLCTHHIRGCSLLSEAPGTCESTVRSLRRSDTNFEAFLSRALNCERLLRALLQSCNGVRRCLWSLLHSTRRRHHLPLDFLPCTPFRASNRIRRA